MVPTPHGSILHPPSASQAPYNYKTRCSTIFIISALHSLDPGLSQSWSEQFQQCLFHRLGTVLSVGQCIESPNAARPDLLVVAVPSAHPTKPDDRELQTLLQQQRSCFQDYARPVPNKPWLTYGRGQLLISNT